MYWPYRVVAVNDGMSQEHRGDRAPRPKGGAHPLANFQGTCHENERLKPGIVRLMLLTRRISVLPVQGISVQVMHVPVPSI